MQINPPKSVKTVIDTLQDNGYEAYAVGGCVRDSYLGILPNDWDITTNARPEEVKSLFRRTVDIGMQHGTVKVMMGREGIEVTTYRIDGKYEDSRHPKEVTFTADLREDLRRRDFTINAMAYSDISALLNSIFDEIYYGDTSMIVSKNQNMNPAHLNELLLLRLYADSGNMTVVVRGENEAQAEAIRDDLLETVLSRKEVFSNFGGFDIEVYGLGTQTVVEPYLKTLQETSTDSLSRMQSSLRTSQTQLSQLVKPASVPQYSKKYMLKNGIKLSIVGFAGGACLMVIALICLVLFRGAVLSNDEIDGEFGLRTLADFSDGKSENEAGLDYMLARIESCTDKMDVKEIGVAGTISGKKLDSIAERLTKKAAESKNGLSFVGLSDIAKDAESYRKLRELNGVIIAEEIGRSSYNDIRNEIGLIADSGTELLGTIYY